MLLPSTAERLLGSYSNFQTASILLLKVLRLVDPMRVLIMVDVAVQVVRSFSDTNDLLLISPPSPL